MAEFQCKLLENSYTNVGQRAMKKQTKKNLQLMKKTKQKQPPQKQCVVGDFLLRFRLPFCPDSHFSQQHYSHENQFTTKLSNS